MQSSAQLDTTTALRAALPRGRVGPTRVEQLEIFGEVDGCGEPFADPVRVALLAHSVLTYEDGRGARAQVAGLVSCPREWFGGEFRAFAVVLERYEVARRDLLVDQ